MDHTKEKLNAKYFDHLEKLRRSGKTNMFGAAPYLRKEFGLTREEAIEILSKWIDSYK